MKRILLLFSMVSCWISLVGQQSYTFTTGGATGQFGPSQSDITTAYAGSNLAGAVTVTNGIQYWVVPQSGYYSIEAFGAQGYGNFGGRGAHITGEFALTAGDTLKILVGQEGAPPVGSGTNQYGGGGGSFVTFTDNTPLVVAGGGGGSWASSFTATTDASITTSGNAGANAPTNGAGGTNGSGGAAAAIAGGGGGLTGDGGLPPYGGLAFVNGGAGGRATTNGGEGGFGGGGGANSWNNRRAGGGGGYSGGGGAGSSTTAFLEGGGGGSYNGGANPVNLAGIQLGDGQVIISPLGFGAAYDAGIVSLDNPSNFCAGSHNVVATIQNFGTNQLTSATINWTVNGVAQSPVSWTGTLDTIGGSGATSAQVTLGSYTFASSIPYNFEIWSSSPNGQTDTVNGNDTLYQVLQTGLIKPTSFAASNVQVNSADLSWNGLGATNFRITYGLEGFDPQTSGTTISVVGTSTTINMLASNTGYEAYVVATCPTGSVYSDTTGPVSFRTPCVIAVAPFSENFDGSSWVSGAGAQNSNASVDPCWSRTPDLATPSVFQMGPRSTSPSSGNGPVQDLTGGNYIYGEASYGGSGSLAELKSPPIDVSGLTTPGLYFFQHRFSNGGAIADMFIEVSNDFGTSWDTVYNITGETQNSTSDAWSLEFVNLVAYTGDTVIIKFVQKSNGCCGDAAIDSVVVDEAPTCPWPTGLSLTATTDSSVVVNWNDPTGSNWELQWGPPGFTQASPGAGTMSTTNNPDTIPGLQSNTEYEVYVRTNCGPNGSSIWIGPLLVRTACAPFAAPYFDNFDNSPANAVPYCWNTYITGGRTTNGVAQTYTFGAPNSTPNHIRFYNGSPAGPSDTTLLISPKFSDLTAGDKRVLFMGNSTTTLTNELIIGTMGDPMDVLSFNAIDTVALTNSYQLYVVEIDLAAGYNGTDQYVAFRHGNSATFRTIYIDDFIYETIPACTPPLPNTLGVSAVYSNAASIFWGAGSDGNETHWEIGTVGFVPGTNSYVSADSVAGNVDTTLATGLSAQTTYEFYIKDSCATGGFSPWVGPFSFTTLCLPVSAPYAENFDGTSWIIGNGSGAQTGTVDACWTRDPEANATWTWNVFNASPSSTNTGPDADYSGTGNFMYTDASYSSASGNADIYSPLIDVSSLAVPYVEFYYHRYGTAAQMGDLEVAVNDGSGWVTMITLTGTDQTSGADPWKDKGVDVSSFGDTIQVRFRGKYVSCCSGDMAIDQFSVGEAPSCPDPAGVSAAVVSDSSAALTWIPNSGNPNYQIWMGPQGFYQGTQTVGGAKWITSNDSVYVDTLTDNSCYEYLVRAVCSPGDTSQWVGPITFCTPCLAFNAPYQETFDVWPLSCWDMTGGAWNWNMFTGPQGDNYAEANFWGQSSGMAFMTSPVIMLGVDSAVVEFDWSHLYSTSYPDDQLLVAVKKLGTSVWDTIVDLKGPTNFNDPTAGNSNDPGDFITHTVGLDPALYTNSAIQVRFIGVTDFGPDLFVNNFKVKYPVSDDLELIGARFKKVNKCLNNSDTAIFQVQNIIGSTVNFATNPLTVHYEVTGPVNTTSSVTVNSGTLPLGDTIDVTASNIDLSQPGNYTLNAWISPNNVNLDPLTDTLLTSVNITIHDDWDVQPDSTIYITNMMDTVILTASSPFLPSGNFMFTEVRHFNSTGAGTLPTYLTADDYIEITGVPNSDLDGITLEVWTGTSAVINYTFPAGTLIGPNGTAIIMQGQGAGPSQPTNFMYDGRGSYTGTFSSGSVAGYILKDGNTVVDAVTYNGYTFPAASGVTAADWSGNIGSPSGTAGIRLLGPDNNLASDWTVVSATTTQDAQVLNPGVPLPAAASITGFDWSLNGSVIDTMPQTVVGPYSSSGVYNYVATFNGPCGLQSDTVTVIVNLAGSCPIPTNVTGTAPACDSIVVNWNMAADSAVVGYAISGNIPSTYGLVINDSSFAATGLTPSTSYDFYVANICNGDTTSVVGPISVNSGTAGAPVAAINFNGGLGGLTYGFDGSTSTGNGNTYSWTFSTGDSATGKSVNYTFPAGGAYTITLVVSNACGSDTATLTLNDVSLSESPLSRSLRLYPNPVDDVLSIELSLEGKGDITIRLMDVSGKQVLSAIEDKTDVDMKTTIDLTDLAKGVYMIEVSDGQYTAVRRLIKE